MHAWTCYPVKHSESLHFDSRLKREHGFIVSSKYQYDLFVQEEYKYPKIAPLPFYFTPSLSPNRVQNTLLSILPHSSEAEKFKSMKEIYNYLDYLESL